MRSYRFIVWTWKSVLTSCSSWLFLYRMYSPTFCISHRLKAKYIIMIFSKTNNTENTTNNCNCRAKEKCPVDKKCQTSSLIYQATVTRHDNNKDATYIGLTNNTFKTPYKRHTNSFRHEKYRNATYSPEQLIWMLKDKKIGYSLKWKIMDRGRAYEPSGRNCHLERFYIIFRSELARLNQRNELATSCRHRRKYLLCNN